MDDPTIEAILTRCEVALEDPGQVDLTRLGFWRVAAAAKKDPSLADRHADRIASIDRVAFERWPLVRVPIVPGTILAVGGALVGLGLAAAAYYVDSPWNGLAVLVATGVLLGTTHGLGHLVVGRSVGIRFTHWFVASMQRPQPGVKIDYASYLHTPARSRAWMHASGAMVTKTIPFLMLGPALAADAPWWTWAALLGLGVFQLITDALWSTKTSDWMKFRREMKLARG